MTGKLCLSPLRGTTNTKLCYTDSQVHLRLQIIHELHSQRHDWLFMVSLQWYFAQTMRNWDNENCLEGVKPLFLILVVTSWIYVQRGAFFLCFEKVIKDQDMVEHSYIISVFASIPPLKLCKKNCSVGLFTSTYSEQTILLILKMINV